MNKENTEEYKKNKKNIIPLIKNKYKLKVELVK
jgi:hypothetical protein